MLTPTLPGLPHGADPTGLHLSDTSDAVVELVEREDLHDVTLIGHSWGGYVITGAAPRLASRLRKVVYWSAFVPAAGRPLYDEVPPPYQELFTAQAHASDNNTVTLPFEAWQAAFMQDAPEPVQRTVHALMVPQPFQYFTETVEPLDWRRSASRSRTCSASTTSRCHLGSTDGTASPAASASSRSPRRAATRRASPSRPGSRRLS